MKIKLIFSVFMTLQFFGYSQNKIVVCGSFKIDSKIKIKIYEPINGYYNMSFYSANGNNNYVINDKDSFYYQGKTNSAVTIKIYITTDNDIFITKSELVLFPSDSVHLDINLLKQNKQYFIYTGSNAAGQKLFNDIENEPVFKYQKVINRLNELKTNKNHFVEDIDSYVKSFTQKFDSLYVKSKITSEFKDYYNVAFAQLLYELVIDKFLRNFKNREVFSKQERDDIVSYFYLKQPITNKYSRSIFNSFLYIQKYYNFLAYKKLGLPYIEALNDKQELIINNITYIIGNDCRQFFFIEDQNIREDLFANYILLAIQMGSPNPIEETINQFKEIFPFNKWDTVIDNLYAGIKSVPAKEYVLQIPIQYIDSSKNINSLNAVFKEMQSNRPIILDLWASWCGPCIIAFQFNKELDSFLIANKMERLYISLDYKGTEKKWQTAIDKYALGGYHILASKLLIEDIKRVYDIPKNGTITIPRYMLISKEKFILIKEAISPINIKELKDQIKTFLLSDKKA